MIREAMQYASLTLFPSIALCLFGIWFTGVFLWIYRKGSAQKYQQLSLVPLQKSSEQSKQSHFQ